MVGERFVSKEGKEGSSGRACGRMGTCGRQRAPGWYRAAVVHKPASDGRVTRERRGGKFRDQPWLPAFGRTGRRCLPGRDDQVARIEIESIEAVGRDDRDQWWRLDSVGPVGAIEGD